MDGRLLLQIAASIVPTQIALIDEEKRWTYEELLRESSYIAHALQHVQREETVAILLTNRVEYAAVLLACWQLGVVAMPVNTRLKEAELHTLFADAACVVTEARYAHITPQECTVKIEQITRMSYDDERPYEQAFTLLTSGSTRTLKKVEIFHEQFADYIFAHQEAPDGTDRGVYLQMVPLFHITGLTSLWNALYSGRTVVLQEGFDAVRWVNAVHTYSVTHSFVVPTMLYDVLTQPLQALHTLTHLTYGGAPMPINIIERAIAALPHVSFSNAYGLTETTATIAALTPDDHRIDGDEKKRARLRSVGKPLADVDIRICRDGNVCAPYEVGVIEVQTARLNRYAGERVQQWFVTHDEGYMDEDGYLFLTGRSQDVIVRGGENIAAHEVEQALLQLPGIVQAAVVGVEHARWGEEVAAMVVSTEELDAQHVQQTLKAELASFKVPQHIIFVQKLPLHATGKVDKRQIIGIFNGQKGKSE